MELSKIEELLEKYFEGNLNEEDEQILKIYFSQDNVVSHLQQYKPIFGFFAEAKQIKSKKKFVLNDVRNRRNNRRLSISIAASLLIAMGAGFFMYTNYYPSNQDDLGTFDDPEIAFLETQKALSLLSKHVNTGYESVEYIDEFEITRNKIFNVNY
ncbi:hypothetical protein [Flavobacterium sp. SM2513]|uniref:hypothetical protein n=1 Tax=Flavobacterium sp. SM2513 TaxID=3424766 RepID=UPI003D7F974C